MSLPQLTVKVALTFKPFREPLQHRRAGQARKKQDSLLSLLARHLCVASAPLGGKVVCSLQAFSVSGHGVTNINKQLSGARPNNTPTLPACSQVLFPQKIKGDSPIFLEKPSRRGYSSISQGEKVTFLNSSYLSSESSL